MKESKGLVQSISRAVEILQQFDSTTELGVSEISRFIGLHKSTTFGLVSTLEKVRLLEKNQDTGKYKLGNELFRLGTKVKADLRSIVNPYLKRLVEEFEETVHLVIHDDCHVLYLDKIESPHSMRICSKIGERLPLYCTGVGKAILAYLDDDEIEKVLCNSQLKKFTEYTVTDKKEIYKRLTEVRSKSYSEDLEELEIGLKCVAAPIFNHTNKAVAAISVAGPTSRMTEELQLSISNALIKYSYEISIKLGYTKVIEK